MTASTRAEDAAPLFVEARRSGRALPSFPDPVPATLAEAYGFQHRLCTALGAPVLGWKVGRIPPAMIDALGAERLAGPVLRCAELANDAPGDARVFAGGAGAIEAEVMLRLAAVPPARIETDEAARACVDRIRAGFEVASSPAPDVHSHAPFGIIADIGINNGILLGPPLPPENFDQLAVTTRIDGVAVGTGRACDVLDGPLGSVRFLVDLHHDGIIRLEPGQWISAGAITGVHPIKPSQTATADFGDDAAIACKAIIDTGF